MIFVKETQKMFIEKKRNPKNAGNYSTYIYKMENYSPKKHAHQHIGLGHEIYKLQRAFLCLLV